MNAPALLNPHDARPLVSTRFTVPGMKCAGCIGKIERELPKVAGIAAARANFSAKRVAISHDPAVGEDALTAALLGLGFEAQPVMPGDTLVVPAQIDRESRYNFVTRALKDWTQIFANFGLGVAAIKSIN